MSMKSKREIGVSIKWGEGSILVRPNGRYQARWFERNPTQSLHRARTFDTLDEAEDHLRTIFRQRRDGEYVSPSERTVEDLVAEWLERGRSRWKPATQSSYQQRADRHVLPSLGAQRAETLTTPRIQHWIDQMVRSGYDPSTIDGATRVLSASLREAVQIGILKTNPAIGVRRPPVTIKEATTWTTNDIASVMAAIGDDPMWSALYRLALTTGMRPGELRALRWSDIDLIKATMTIRRTVTKDADGRVVIGATTKTGKSRTLALSGQIVRSLSTWRSAQRVIQLAHDAWHRDDLVFDRGDGRFLPLTSWQHRHDAITLSAGVPRITLHQLRHTSATLALESGQHPLIVSRRLGHKSIQTTLDVYSHVSMDLQRAAAESFDSGLFGPDEGVETA